MTDVLATPARDGPAVDGPAGAAPAATARGSRASARSAVGSRHGPGRLLGLIPLSCVVGAGTAYVLWGWPAWVSLCCAVACCLAVLLGLAWWWRGRIRSSGGHTGGAHAGRVQGAALLSLTLLAVLLAGTTADAASRERAHTLLALDRSRISVLTVEDPRSTPFGTLVEVRILSGPAHGTRALLSLGDQPRGKPERGSTLTAWFAATPLQTREPAALRLRAVSDPLTEPRPPQDAPSTQRLALRALFSGPNDPGPKGPEPGGAGDPWPDWLNEGSALVPGMVAGDRTLQGETLSAQMRVAGLSHLTAVSGANVVLLLSGVFALCRRLRVPRWARLPVGLMALGFFVALVGPEPSVLRAATMGALASVAVSIGRPRLSLLLLATAVTVLVAWDPWHVQRAAFQLSVLATAGIVLLSAPLTRAGQALRLPTWCAEALAVCVAATVACTPVLVILSPEQSTLTIPANLLAAPCAALVGTLGPWLLAMAGLGQPWCWPLAVACLLPAQAVASIGAWASEHGAMLHWPEGAAGPLLAAGCCWAGPALLWGLSRRWKHWRELAASSQWLWRYRRAAQRRRTREVLVWTVSVIVCLLGGWLVPGWAVGRAATALQDGDLLFCDVGQGDATVLIAGEGKALLIDAGPQDGGVQDCLKGAGIHSLCAALITHLDADHVGGLRAALAIAPAQSISYGTASRAAPVPGAQRATAPSTESCGRWVVDVRLVPQAREENDASLVVRASNAASGDRLDVLIAGDLEEDAARAALARVPSAFAPAGGGGAGGYRVLKVSHHGAANGGPDVPRAFAPDLALIGVGQDNDYGHPAPKTLQTLVGLGTPIQRTDQDGTILVRATPEGIRVWTHQ